MRTTTEFGDRSTKRSGEQGGAKNPPAAARNLMPPFPGQRVYGTDPRRQGYVARDILQKRKNISSHRAAPLTAPVPFRKTLCTSGKGGKGKGTGSRLAPALMAGQTAASKVSGAPPLRPRTGKNQNYRLTRGGLLMEAHDQGRHDADAQNIRWSAGTRRRPDVN